MTDTAKKYKEKGFIVIAGALDKSSIADLRRESKFLTRYHESQGRSLVNDGCVIDVIEQVLDQLK